MGEILGATISHFPFIRMKPEAMPGVLKGLVAGRGWEDKPHLRDPKNWPPPMQEEWGEDQGTTAGRLAQERQIEQFRTVRGALDAFNPDFILMNFRDLGEAWGADRRPHYWFHLQDHMDLKLFQIFGNRDNYFGEDPDRVDRIVIHREGVEYLMKRLEEMGRSPLACTESKAPTVLGHNGLAGVMHLDWDRREFKTPFVFMGVDPFGFSRTRGPDGLSPWDRSAPPPLAPSEAFGLGRAIAGALKESPWRVAFVTPTNWSNAQNTGVDQGRLHPDIDADEARFRQWKNNEFDRWGENWTFEEMEAHAQWECLNSIILAGAMTEIGAGVTYADLQTTWALNGNWVTTLFEPR